MLGCGNSKLSEDVCFHSIKNINGLTLLFRDVGRRLLQHSQCWRSFGLRKISSPSLLRVRSVLWSRDREDAWTASRITTKHDLYVHRPHLFWRSLRGTLKGMKWISVTCDSTMELLISRLTKVKQSAWPLRSDWLWSGTMDAMMTAKGDVWDPPEEVISNCNREVDEALR